MRYLVITTVEREITFYKQTTVDGTVLPVLVTEMALSGTIINIISLDDINEYVPEVDTELVQSDEYSIGDYYSGF